MISEVNIQKIQKFCDTLKKVQPSSGHDLGLIVSKEENMADIQAALPEPNNVSVYELDIDTLTGETIKQFLSDLQNRRTVLVRLHEFLDPEIYNQLYLIAQSGRADFFLPGDSITFDVPKESALILVSTDEELEKLNYKNIFDLTGPVLRLGE